MQTPPSRRDGSGEPRRDERAHGDPPVDEQLVDPRRGDEPGLDEDTSPALPLAARASREEAARDRSELVHAVRVVLLRFAGLPPEREGATQEIAEAVRTLCEVLTTHHREEEERLFAFASRFLGDTDPMLETLTNHHRALEVHLRQIDARLSEEGDFRGAAEDFRRFSARFETFTLVESDYFATLWDDLFPGEVSPG